MPSGSQNVSPPSAELSQSRPCAPALPQVALKSFGITAKLLFSPPCTLKSIYLPVQLVRPPLFPPSRRALHVNYQKQFISAVEFGTYSSDPLGWTSPVFHEKPAARPSQQLP